MNFEEFEQKMYAQILRASKMMVSKIEEVGKKMDELESKNLGMLAKTEAKLAELEKLEKIGDGSLVNPDEILKIKEDIESLKIARTMILGRRR